VAYPSSKYELRNGSTVLDTKTAYASCAAGTTWNNTICTGGPVPPPSISSFSPNPMTASTNLKTVTVTGNNFQSGTGAHLLFSGPTGNLFSSADHPERYKSITPTQWQYDMNNAGAKGTWHVQVFNPDGQSSNSWPFQVQ
jgi:hypothetical protein